MMLILFVPQDCATLCDQRKSAIVDRGLRRANRAAAAGFFVAPPPPRKFSRGAECCRC